MDDNDDPITTTNNNNNNNEDLLCNTAPDDETLIRDKKRARRVSFAENTSIHIFQRDDEDYSSSATTTTTSNNPQSIENAGDDDDANLFHDLGDFRISTSTPGSATSNEEEDNFFGPVSSSFIKHSQQHSDSSAQSDFNHDITLDSTAMSMHFQSLVPSPDSISTPPNLHTPQKRITIINTSAPSSMPHSHKKPPVFPFLVASGGDSSDMSFIDSNPSNKYDYYGKLSPTLEALLAKDYHASSVSHDQMSISKSLSDHLNTQVSSPTVGHRRVQLHTDCKGNESLTEDIPIQMVYDGSSKLVEPNAGTIIASSPNYLTNANVTTASPAHQKRTLFDSIEVSKLVEPNAGTVSASSPNCLANARVTTALPAHQKRTLFDSIQVDKLVEPNSGIVIVSSPNCLANAKVATASPAHQKPTLSDSIQQDQYSKFTTMEQRQELAGGANALRNSANASIILGKQRGIVDKDSLHQSSQKEHANVGDIHTPMRWMCSVNSPVVSPDVSFLTRTDPAKIGRIISVQKSLHKSASPRARKTATASRLVKRSVDRVVEDHTGKETQPFSESDSIYPFVRRGPLSFANIGCSDGLGNGHQHQNQFLQENISVEDVDGHGRKRRIEDIGPMDKNNVVEIGNKNPKVNIEMGGSVSEDWSNLSRVGNNEVEKSKVYEAQGHWANHLEELSGDIERLLIPSIGKLNTPELEILENMVERMQNVTKYEKLCTLAQFQRAHDLQANHHQERIAEARCVQETIFYERAKLLILRAKQERLRKQVQLLQSGIQEAKNMKFNVKKVLQHDAKDAHMQNISMPSLSSVHHSSNSDAYSKVITKRQELGVLDLKVKNLTKSVLNSCKIKEEPSLDKCIELVDDYVKRKTRCRLIQKELQLCEVDRMEAVDGNQVVVLNYYDVLLQSFTKTHASYSTLVTFNSVNIMKSLPNINACTAFAFVFNEVTRNLGSSSKSLAAETQMTRSLLHSLLLVVEEAHQACIELRNLAETNFRSPNDGLLELEFSFVDYKTSNKVKLILDVTCLNCGVYPHVLNPRISMTETVESLSTEIEAAIKSSKAGCLMISRLCRSISRVVRTESR